MIATISGLNRGLRIYNCIRYYDQILCFIIDRIKCILILILNDTGRQLTSHCKLGNNTYIRTHVIISIGTNSLLTMHAFIVYDCQLRQ